MDPSVETPKKEGSIADEVNPAGFLHLKLAAKASS
jgi:hypothetical protein